MEFKFNAGSSSLRLVLFLFRFMQWASAVIVMGIASYYIHQYSPEGEHIIYAEVIATTATVFYLFPLAAAFMKSITWHTLPLDLIYSYFWLTAFIFEAQDYNYLDCAASDPSDIVSGTTSCSLKYALEAFACLAFLFTVFALIAQTFIWVDARVAAAPGTYHEKNGGRPSESTA
jgi:hypothetical protein